MKVSTWEGTHFAIFQFEKDEIGEGEVREAMYPVVKDILNSAPWCVSLDQIASQKEPWNQLPPEFVEMVLKTEGDHSMTFLTIYGNESVLNSIVEYMLDLETLLFTIGEDSSMVKMFEQDRDSWARTVEYLTLLNKLRGARISRMVDEAYSGHAHEG